MDRVIEPLGLVLKAGEWYVVAGARGEPRTYRVSSILGLTVRDETFSRPEKFDLAEHWAASTARFEAGLRRGTALVRVSPSGLARLRAYGAAVAATVDRAGDAVDAQGWTRRSLPIESIDHAASQLLGLGPECEVLEPPALRERLASLTQQMARIYARG